MQGKFEQNATLSRSRCPKLEQSRPYCIVLAKLLGNQGGSQALVIIFGLPG